MADEKKIKVEALEEIHFGGKIYPAGDDFEMPESEAKALAAPRSFGGAAVRIVPAKKSADK